MSPRHSACVIFCFTEFKRRKTKGQKARVTHVLINDGQEDNFHSMVDARWAVGTGLFVGWPGGRCAGGCAVEVGWS